MRAKVLIDNISRDGLIAEWGLAVWIEYEGHKILLDTGTTGAFADNARRMGVSLDEAELCVISHGHYDHANGLNAFFRENDRARVYFRDTAQKHYYGIKEGKYRYIGVNREILRKHADRLEFARGNVQLLPGVWLIPHSSPGLEKIAARSDLYVRRWMRMKADNFSHEQSLVFETEKGLVIFNSCSHAGPDNIIAEVNAAFPGKNICALIGGLHLYKLTDDEVRAFAARLRSTGVKQVFTGHCTGERAFVVLKEELGEIVEQLYTGMEIEV